MRGVCVIIAAAALSLAGCGSNGSHATAEQKCTARMESAARPRLSHAQAMEARRYVDVTYCARFARRGWLYPDGTWRLAAVRWVDGGKYATGAGPIDCGPLHFARRADVKIYLAELRRKLGRLTCDDGAPLAQLGVP